MSIRSPSGAGRTIRATAPSETSSTPVNTSRACRTIQEGRQQAKEMISAMIRIDPTPNRIGSIGISASTPPFPRLASSGASPTSPRRSRGGSLAGVAPGLGGGPSGAGFPGPGSGSGTGRRNRCAPLPVRGSPRWRVRTSGNPGPRTRSGAGPAISGAPNQPPERRAGALGTPARSPVCPEGRHGLPRLDRRRPRGCYGGAHLAQKIRARSVRRALPGSLGPTEGRRFSRTHRT